MGRESESQTVFEDNVPKRVPELQHYKFVRVVQHRTGLGSHRGQQSGDILVEGI
jgi:hypothetical protein